MDKFSRRAFVHTAVATAGALVLTSCESDPVPKPARRSARSTTTEHPIQVKIPEGLTREELFSRLDQRVRFYMNACHHCAQTSFVVLQEQFGLEDDAILKALTPLPGIGERGETCGAVIGCLMAIGLVYGRDRLDDWAGYRASLIPARSFCSRFQEAFGSTMCGDIVESAFGRRYDLGDEADLAAFQQAGATERCGAVVQEAVRITAEIILERT